MAPVITGVGRTDYTRKSGKSILELATEASLAALADAGLTPEDVGGIVTFHDNDTVQPYEVSSALGTGPLAWSQSIVGGGSEMCAAIGAAADVVTSGRTDHVIMYRALNGASGKRMGSFGASAVDDYRQFMAPYGYASPVQVAAMAAQRHMAAYGTTREQLGAIAVTQRENALLNPRAFMKEKPLTLDAYLSSRPISEPLHLLDCCLENDGAVAIIISREPTGTQPAVTISSWAYGAGPHSTVPYEKYPDITSMFPVYLRDELYGRAGVGATDIDVACIYDAFTYSALSQLEDFGFCEKGEGGPFAASGAIARDGQVALNPGGGLLSEGYIHGMNNVAEAVDQLRGITGDRQVADAEVALISGYSFTRGSAMILTKG